MAKNNDTIPDNDDYDPFEGMTEEDIADIFEVFFEDTSEKLIEISQLILELENNTETDSVINKILQAFHSIKGTGGTFGFSVISIAAHKFESIMEGIKKSGGRITSHKIDRLLISIDLFKKLADDIRARRPTDHIEVELLRAAAEMESVEDATDKTPGVQSAPAVRDAANLTAEGGYFKLKMAKLDKIVSLTCELSSRKHLGGGTPLQVTGFVE